MLLSNNKLEQKQTNGGYVGHVLLKGAGKGLAVRSAWSA